MKLAIEAKTGNIPEKREHKITPPDKIASEEMLQAFIGRYATLSMLGSIERNKNLLSANVRGYKFKLVPSSDGRFGVERKWLVYRFLR